MREVASGSSHNGVRGTLYALPLEGADREIFVVDTNGDPVWQDEVSSEDWDSTLEFYGITL